MRMGVKDAIERLERRRPSVIDLTLERVLECSRLLNHPERDFKSIHIAGTNGKGSTAAFLSEILIRKGLSVGLLTSPHLVDVRERIKINGVDISGEEFAGKLALIEEIEREGGVRPLTYFEVVTMVAFKYFSDMKVDWAVVEVGMGGRLDSTNIIVPKVSIITRVSYDHQRWLGRTLRDITREKCGIIKRDVPVVTTRQVAEVMDVIKAAAECAGSPLIVAEPLDSSVKLGLSGGHQRENAALAVEAFKLVEGISFREWNMPSYIGEALLKTRWPGRMQVVSERPLVILDGAHNPDGVKALARHLNETYPNYKKRFIVGIMADKDFRSMIGTLSNIADELAFVPVANDRSSSPQELKDIACSLSARKVSIFRSLSEAVSIMVKDTEKDDLICITGSLYLAGEYLKKQNLDCKTD